MMDPIREYIDDIVEQARINYRNARVHGAFSLYDESAEFASIIDALETALYNEKLRNAELAAGGKIIDVFNSLPVPDDVRTEEDEFIDHFRKAQERAYTDAVEHGLWEDYQYNQLGFMNAISNVVANEVVELTYACVDYWCSVNSKDSEKLRDAMCEEAADVAIGLMSFCGWAGIDLGGWIARKMKINKDRPWKHGKER